ncbi:hypothetical protein LZG04_38510 [Saccharothrix sp. S26]|uniref:hypothetical protein n=1 Tax=Saccharothrix sp. S26 TaxID=2907215 RepID=UPI001F29A285|nr:hypothetical protein [Saccharothrix sp. S26]MCE7000669.1 hypothetical protein [Saccharothrix sp. S26]
MLPRRVQVRSGFTPAEVALRGGVPRSTAHQDGPGTCGLPEPQVEKVVVVRCESQGTPVDAAPPAEPEPRDPAAEAHHVTEVDEALRVRDVVVPLVTGLARPVPAWPRSW